MAGQNDENGPPPLPPPVARPSTYGPTSYGVDPYAPYNNATSGFGNPYGSPYGMSGYGNYGGPYGSGMFGQYGGTGGMFPGQSPESNFVRLAEESSRNAFQSIESVVSAVTSVANMLNSTHNAVFSSFRAVIGVVEQFSILKRQLSAVLTFTILRWLRHFWRKLMIYLRLKPANYGMANDAWTDATSVLPSASSSAPFLGISWPAMIFWLVALGSPYLIYKCVSRMVRSIEEKQRWATGASEHHKAEALYDFNARNQQELSIRKGDWLRVAPSDEQPRIKDWLLASSVNGEQIGLVPINYVLVKKQTSQTPPRAGSPPGAAALTSASGPSTSTDLSNLEAAFRHP